MTEAQNAPQTTYLAPPTLSPPLGERELLSWNRREKEDAQRERARCTQRGTDQQNELEWF